MPETHLTPEEKLLRIIEAPPGVVRPLKQKRWLHDAGFSWKLWQAKYASKFKDTLSLKSANALLVFAAVLATIFLGLDFWLGMPRAGAIQRLEARAKNFDTGDLSVSRPDALPVYLREITQRNIFALPQEPKKEAAVAQRAAVDASLLTADLKLVGIIWSEAPQAIVEDTKETRTHLLNRGGKIKNLRVKEILKDRVILSYDNQDIELR